MANPFPFVSGDVLTAAELNGIGEAATAYTPTFTNLTLGNGTLTAKYNQVNKLVSVYVHVLFGSTTAITGNVSVTYPIARASATSFALGTAGLFDTGVQTYIGTLNVGATTMQPAAIANTGAGWAGSVPLSATVPYTWGNTDILQISLQYEVA
jgi:hypothetical protein